MKTNFKTTVLALALVASVTGVFANNISNAISGKKLVAYTWQKYESDGTTEDGLPQPGDENNPFAEECSGLEGTRCAVGTPVIPESGDVIEVFYPN